MLLHLSPEELQKLLDNYEKECADIKKGALAMAWHMRGSVSYTDILNMSVSEREAINDIIEKNIKITKETGNPYI